MPKHVPPLTLQKACVLTLAYNWDWICYSCPSNKQMQLLIETEDYLKYEGPFSNMPSQIIEDVMEGVSSKRSLSRKYLHLLMKEQLQHLNLGLSVTGEIHQAIRFLPRCKKLRDLSLAYMRHVEPMLLMSIIPHLTCMVSLDLEMTCAIDAMLDMIGYYCPNLREINLTSTMITDDGIRKLCGAYYADGIKRSQKLQRLIITETRVTADGALCALRNLPCLVDFDFNKIFQAFEHLDPNSVVDSEDYPSLKLRTLYSISPCIRPDSIDAAAALCPNTELLSVMNAWIDNDTLYKFMQFEHLKSLTIVNNDGLTLDYDEGILPLMQVVGPGLENLILNKFVNVDLISLGRSCPRLQKLALCNIGVFQNTSSHPEESLFKCLSALEMWCDDRTEFLSFNALSQLLCSSVNLKNLLVKKCDAFGSTLLRQIWVTNPMKQLSRITIDECQCMDVEILDHLLRMENLLGTIRIWSCPIITQEIYNVSKAKIKANNQDVYLEWFP